MSFCIFYCMAKVCSFIFVKATDTSLVVYRDTRDWLANEQQLNTPFPHSLQLLFHMFNYNWCHCLYWAPQELIWMFSDLPFWGCWILVCRIACSSSSGSYWNYQGSAYQCRWQIDLGTWKHTSSDGVEKTLICLGFWFSEVSLITVFHINNNICW